MIILPQDDHLLTAAEAEQVDAHMQSTTPESAPETIRRLEKEIDELLQENLKLHLALAEEKMAVARAVRGIAILTD